MADLKYDPVPDNQKTFLEKASKRRGFCEVYDALEAEYAHARDSLKKQSLIAWAPRRAPSQGWKVRGSMRLPWHHSRDMQML